jgi:hypothetical protein
MSVPDPRQVVEEPVRRALGGVIARGVALVAVVGALAACPLVFHPDVPTRDALAVAAPVLLIAYALLVNARRLARGGTSPMAREEAWVRASEVDAADAQLGRMIATCVPAGLLVALGVLAWPHLTDANQNLAAAWVVLGLPSMTFAWMFASTTWLDACRDDLARAEGESDARFRRYWANPGR